MIDHTIPNLLFIRGCTLGLRIITPLSIFYCSLSIADPPHNSFTRFLLSWSIIETSFWLLVFVPRKRALQASANHPPPLDREERKALFWRCWDQIPNPEWYVSRWFLGARPGEVRRENVAEFFRWAVLNKGDAVVKKEGAERDANGEVREGEDADALLKREEEEELNEYVDGIQTLLGRTLEPGKGPAKSLRLTIDEVKMLHRPVVWYLAVLIVDTFTAARLRCSSFLLHRTSLRQTLSIFPPRLASLVTTQRSPAGDLAYWYRPHTSKTRLPILFIHGIGIGLYPYVNFLNEINKHDPKTPEDGEVGIIAVELMPISFRITSPMIDRDETCRQINAILDKHGFNKVVLISHSYGSVITTHLLQNPTTAARIGPMLLVDPVTFLLHLPDVAYNFTARQPRRANEHQLHYYATSDMMVSHTLARNFFWAENVLWKEDLGGRPVTVSLGGKDLISDTETVGRYIAGVDLKTEDKTWKDRKMTGNGLEILWFPTCDHAQVFERVEGRKKLADVVRSYVEKADDVDDQLP
ncbi:hypothetical protein P280DRAFT_404281 [Massarina eburnea CBS 473.64]|uniref:AB hydrolase-1 domain-containing protein n=1 Tax=Massarina eburnea CBS 473.64 TaxID=1395130 RepID=A0A6A6RXN0_9PLEO|nr:hypothetical protein P280DRAFT_404281 [Massarina eburnea CBS 473.64]